MPRMMDEIDIPAERERALQRAAARTEADQRRSRARTALRGRWDATAEELRTAIVEAYPQLGTDDEAAELDRVLEVALEVQRTERTRVNPADLTTPITAPDTVEGKRWKAAPAPPRAPREKTMMAETATKTPVAETVEAKPEPRPMDLRILSGTQRSKLEKAVARAARETPGLGPVAVQELVAEEFGWSIKPGQAERLLQKATGEQREKPAPAEAKAKPAAPPAEKKPAPAALKVVPRDEVKELFRELADHVRALGAVATPRAEEEGDEFVRIEFERGEWRLRADLRFPTREDVYRVAGAIGTAVANAEAEEVSHA